MTQTDTRAGGGRTRRGWLHPTILRAAVLAVAAGYGQFALTTVLGDVAVAFGETASTSHLDVGLQATTLGIGLAVIRLAAIFALPATAVADRHGRRRPVLTFAATGLVCTVAAAAAPGYWWLVGIAALSRPLLSATNAIAHVIAAEETTSADRAKGLAVVQASYAIGAGIVSVVHGLAGDVLGFRGVFAIAALPLLALPLVARGLEEPALYTSHGTSAIRRPAFGMVRPELRGRLALVALLAGLMSVVTGPAFTYLFVMGEVTLGASRAVMAGLVVAAGPIGLVGLLVGRWAADRLGRRVTAAITMAATAGASTVAYTGTFVALTAGYLATAMVAGAFGPAGGALLTEVFPTDARATASGWTAAAGVVGAVVGLGLFGFLGQAMGSFGTAGAILWLPVVPLTALYALLPETRGHELDEPIVTPT